MRRLAACLILTFAFAVPAAAQQGRVTGGQTTQDQAGLKGSVSAAPAPPPEEASLLLPLPVQPTSISSNAGGGAQCRLSCSQTYYFCLAGEDDRCPRDWSRCVSGCSS